MNRERLLRLIDILQAVDPEHYDQTMWCCGPSACAGGYAAQDPIFNALGLSNTSLLEFPVEEFDEKTPYYNSLYGIAALQAFFDLTHKAAVHIFGSYAYFKLSRALADEADDDTEDDEEVCGRYIKPSHVIARIEEILA